MRLEPPRVAVVSMHHYINHGGAEFVVYRATPADVESGVRVGDRRVPGLPASRRRRPRRRPGAARRVLRAARTTRTSNTPISVFARDEAGNEATAVVRRRRVPEAVPEEPDPDRRPLPAARRAGDPREHAALKVDNPGDLLAAFLKINGDLRRMNAEQIAALSPRRPRRRCCGSGPFAQLGNSQVEARFADQRTYFYKGKEIDQQVHLGFDLAVTANVPVVAANRGHGRLRRLARHLRQLRHRRSRHGRAVALRAPVVDRREGGRHASSKGAGARPQRHDRAGRRRPPALHDAGGRRAGEPGRVVEHTLDGGPRAAQDPRGGGRAAGPGRSERRPAAPAGAKEAG